MAQGRSFSAGLLVVPLSVDVVARLLSLLVDLLWPDQVSGARRLGAWDGGYYLDIVRHGYPSALAGAGQPGSPLAFLPGYPLLVRGVQVVVPLSTPVLAAVVAVALSLVATAGVTLVASLVLERRAAIAAGVLWSVWPAAYVLGLDYSESMFIAAASCALYWTLRSQWLLAGLFCSIAAITRPTGVAVVAGLALAVGLAVRRGERGRPLLALLLAGVLPVAWLVYVRVHTGAWTVWYIAEKRGWTGRPLGVLRRLELTALHPSRNPWWDAVAVSVLVMVVLAALLARQRSLPVPLLGYVATILVLVTVANASVYSSLPRLLWSAFPLMFPLATALSARRSWLIGVAAVSSLLMIVTSVLVVTQTGHVVP